MAPRRRADDRGYALVAAIAAVAAFAYIAFQALAADRGEIAGVGARLEQARLEAAADAGLMIAVHAMGDADAGRRWPIDGRPRRVEFDGMVLDVSVQDERGKVPLDGLNPSQSRALFEAGGASDDRVNALVDELRSFQSGEDDSLGADAPVDQSFLDKVRQGGFRSVSDLMALKDMDAPLFERIAPAATVFFEESGPFEPSNASALARTAMAGDQTDMTDLLPSQLSDDTPQPSQPVAQDLSVTGRTLTVQVVARDRRGAQTHRTAIVELTGAPDQPYWIRSAE